MLFLRSFFVNTTKGVDLIHVGHEVRGFLRESKAAKGWVHVSLPRPGCGVLTLDSKEKGAVAVDRKLAPLVPKTLTLPVDQGKMLADPWQEIYLVDYGESGQRREVVVQIWGEDPPPPQPQGFAFG